MDQAVTALALSLGPVFTEIARVLKDDGKLVLQTRDIRYGGYLLGPADTHRRLAEAAGFRLMTEIGWESSPARMSRDRALRAMWARGQFVTAEVEKFLVFARTPVARKCGTRSTRRRRMRSQCGRCRHRAVARPTRMRARSPSSAAWSSCTASPAISWSIRCAGTGRRLWLRWTWGDAAWGMTSTPSASSRLRRRQRARSEGGRPWSIDAEFALLLAAREYHPDPEVREQVRDLLGAYIGDRRAPRQGVVDAVLARSDGTVLEPFMVEDLDADWLPT